MTRGRAVDRGLASAGREVVGPLVLGAWDDFLDVVEGSDLSRGTRLPGWRGQEVAVHLGAWDDHRALEGLVASARAGGGGAAPDVDAVNARVVAAHREAPRADVLAALRRHRDDVARYLAEAPDALDVAPTAGPVGPLPLLSVVAGEGYELAVHALDLAAAGGPAPSPALLQAGLAALADVTGALAASTGVEGGAALLTPGGGWAFEALDGGWRVTELPGDGDSPGAVVRGSAGTVLDVSAGRANAVAALARRQIVVSDMAALLRLAPVVDVAPNIPGGPLLRLAARSLAPVGGLLGRLRR